MKSNEKKFSKTISALLIICALSFSTNTNAAPSLTFGSWVSSLFRNNPKPPTQNNTQKKHKHFAGCGHNDHGGQDGSTSVPLDGGLSILLIGAAAFGVKKLRGNKDEEI